MRPITPSEAVMDEEQLERDGCVDAPDPEPDDEHQRELGDDQDQQVVGRELEQPLIGLHDERHAGRQQEAVNIHTKACVRNACWVLASTLTAGSISDCCSAGWSRARADDEVKGAATGASLTLSLSAPTVVGLTTSVPRRAGPIARPEA